jgi:hypothetical protein
MNPGLIRNWRGCRPLVAWAALSLAACAGYSGRGLQPGVATLPEIMATMGEPAMNWRDADGGVQLAYPRGPGGPHTYMVFVGPDGRLLRIENVLDMAHFPRIRPGDNQASVLRLIGPPVPQWTDYYQARDELVWEWPFCDGWNQLARFDVLFDASTGIVRTSHQRQDLRGPDGVAPFCGR